jgi:endonuclease-3 related protein
MVLSPKKLYIVLLNHFGHQDWWPIDTRYHQKQGSDPRFEIIIGAILTQNTVWTNVEKALENLKLKNTLTINTIAHLNEKTLKTMIQPSGFFNQKAQRLKHLAQYLHEHYHGDLQQFFSRDTHDIRQELLALKGIGLETADSILLYAGNHPIFVVDAYTKRLCKRIPVPIKGDTYEDIQYFFEKELKRTTPNKDMVPVYKELHALLVELAKNYCRKKPFCNHCPLTTLCEKCL